MLEKVQNQLAALGVLAGTFLLLALAVIVFSDPARAGVGTVSALYFSIFLFSWTFFALILYGLRSRFARSLHHQMMGVSMRQGFLTAVFITGSLALSSKGLLHWWLELTFLIALALLEGFFLV